MQTQKKNVTKSATCRNRSFRKFTANYIFSYSLIRGENQITDTLFNHAVSISVKMSPQDVIHVIVQSAGSGLATVCTAGQQTCLPSKTIQRLKCIVQITGLMIKYKEKGKQCLCLSVQHVLEQLAGHKTNSVTLAQFEYSSVEFPCANSEPLSNPNACILIIAICSPRNTQQSAPN
jgi:hypothetical protein